MKLAQSNVIFFALFVGFVIFVTVRGDLPAYLNVLFKTQTPQPTTTGEPSAASGGASSGTSSGTGSVFGNGILGQASSAIDGVRTSILGSLGVPSAVSNFGSSVTGFLGGLF